MIQHFFGQTLGNFKSQACSCRCCNDIAQGVNGPQPYSEPSIPLWLGLIGCSNALWGREDADGVREVPAIVRKVLGRTSGHGNGNGEQN